jgi:hypothetical protein
VSAQFAAFVWFTNDPMRAKGSPDAALEFARQNWRSFLPLAHPGLGRLLLKIANDCGDPECNAQRDPLRPGINARFSCN